MRKLFLLIGVLSISLSIYAQSPQLREIWKLYDKEKFDEIIEKGELILTKDSNNIEINYWVGVCYYRNEEILNAIPFLEKAALHNDPHSSIRARAKLILGVCYYYQGKKEKSKDALLEGKKVKTYKRVVEGNKFWYERFGFDDFFLDWQKIESEHFIFKFQDTTELNYKRFIKSCEQAYCNIDTFFNSKIDRKIDYFVWTSTIDARNIIKMSNAHAFSNLLLIHGNTNENEGHEIAHVISLNFKDDIKKYKFISEGTAVYFDQTHLDKDQWFEDLLEYGDIKKIEVKKVWEKWNKYPTNYSYHLGGMFIRELIHKYGHNKFLTFFEDQSYDNAVKVFGKGFEDFVENFESTYNEMIKKKKN